MSKSMIAAADLLISLKVVDFLPTSGPAPATPTLQMLEMLHMVNNNASQTTQCTIARATKPLLAALTSDEMAAWGTCLLETATEVELIWYR